MSERLDLEFVRAQFPALTDDFALFDNAGGSVACIDVIERVVEFMSGYGVQVGASYQRSADALNNLIEARKELAEWINAKRFEEVVIGGSTTALIKTLSEVLAKTWKEGDEIIVTDGEHESNVGYWRRLADQGIVVKEWSLNPDSLEFELADLGTLITDRTKLVAVTQTSNIFGMVNPVKDFANYLHDRGIKLCVDGVAFAPHRQVDVQAIGADYYVFSIYKVYGPHQAILWADYDHLVELPGINHWFLDQDAVPYKFLPGNYNFELTYGSAGVPRYLKRLADHHGVTGLSGAYQLIQEHEATIGNMLVDYINNKPELSLVRPKGQGLDFVPTIAFVHEHRSSKEIVEAVDSHAIGIRFGDFYSKGIAEKLELKGRDGVVRTSMTHYNSVEEVERLINVFDQVLA